MVVPTRGEAMGARFHAEVALLYAIETGLCREGAEPEELAVDFAEAADRARRRSPTIRSPRPAPSSVPRAQRQGDGRESRSTRCWPATVDDGRPAHRRRARCARRPRSPAPPAAPTLARNFERGADLVAVPQEVLMRDLRPAPPRPRARRRRELLGAAAELARRLRRGDASPPSSRRRPRSTRPRPLPLPLLSGPMDWKTAYRSLYYDGAPEPDDPVDRPGARPPCSSSTCRTSISSGRTATC